MQSPALYKAKQIKRELRIPAGDNTVDQDLLTMVKRMHYRRLRNITTQIGAERGRIFSKQKEGAALTERENAFLDLVRVVRICKAEYYKDLKQYSILFTAFNFIEDAARGAVNEKYYETTRRYDWHKEISLWPEWYYSKISSDQDKLARVLELENSSVFLEKLDFGALLGFLSSEAAWNRTVVPSLFVACRNKEGGELPALSREEVDERLSILQRCRNIVFHHNVIPNPLRLTIDSRAIEVNSSPTDVFKRISEILSYFGISLSELMDELRSRDDEGYLQ